MADKEKGEEVMQPTEQATEQSAEEAAKTQPEISIEDLQSQITDKDAKIKELRQGIAKHAESERKLRDQSESITSLHKRLEAQEESNATMLDYLEDIRGQSVEETPTRPTSHRDKLASQRAERDKTKTETAVDPEVSKFFTFVDLQGLDTDDSLVKEAVADRTPKDALKYLQGKVKEAEDVKIAKLVEEKAQSLKEQKLKESGLTTAGVEGPNAASQDDNAFVRSYSEGKSDDHARAQKLLANIK